MPKRATKRATKIVFGMMGPFTIGHAGTAQRQTKLKLAYAINHIVKTRKLARAASTKWSDLNRQKISNLRDYKLEGFSVEELTVLLTALGNKTAGAAKTSVRGD